MVRPFIPVIHRLRVTPDEPLEGPRAIVGERPRRNGRASRRPHTDMRVDAVRRLIEQTALTYSEIAARTGVGRASICRWTRDHGWVRPLYAPRATDLTPTARASQRLKLRTLAERLRAIAERYLRDLEAQPQVDVELLVQALQVVQMAKLAAMGRRRRRGVIVGRPSTGSSRQERDDAIRAALKEMRRGGVDLERIPPEAMELLSDASVPAEDHPALKARKGRRRAFF